MSTTKHINNEKRTTKDISLTIVFDIILCKRFLKGMQSLSIIQNVRSIPLANGVHEKKKSKKKAVTFTLGCYIPLPQGAVQKNLRGMCNFSAIVQNR